MEIIEILDSIASRMSQEKILDLFYSAGCKEPKKMKIKPNGWTTIRCSDHEDSEDHRLGKRASLNVNVDTGAFKCMSCGFSGNLLSIAKRVLNTSNGKEALQFLADEAGITLDDSTSYVAPKPREKPKPKPIEYIRVDRERLVVNIDIDAWLPKLDKMTEVQQYKLLLTSIYHASLEVDQSKKNDYYGGRKIKNPRTQLIGFIHKGDAKFWEPIEAKFGIERLVHFGIYNGADAQYNPLGWKYSGRDVCFVPSFDLYTNLLTGAMLRPTIKPNGGQKEFSLNKPLVVEPIPFALTHDILTDNDEPIWFTEGSVDGLSLGASRVFAAIPGVNSISEEMLGLFQDKTIVLALDADGAGQKAIFGYTDSMETFHEGFVQKLKKAGVAKIFIARWDESYGKDLNDLLKSGNLNKISVTEAEF